MKTKAKNCIEEFKKTGKKLGEEFIEHLEHLYDNDDVDYEDDWEIGMQSYHFDDGSIIEFLGDTFRTIDSDGNCDMWYIFGE